ncbi:MAG: protein kinase [Gemmataceae bacterium]|nr:protein kinase [Gemmata sp.]MDW8199190.1 protein kinase [Gemmataceae bacterium]
MSIACPYCKAVLNPKGLKPGRFQPKCPGCGKPFVLVVADDARTVRVQALPTAPPPPPKRKLTPEEHAALLLEGKNPADYGEPPDVARPQPAPGAGTIPVKTRPKPEGPPAPAPVDPNVTGDFTEPESPAPSPAVRASRTITVHQPDMDPNATGDFTEPEHSRRHKLATADPGATGEFTEAQASSAAFHDKPTQKDPADEVIEKPRKKSSRPASDLAAEFTSDDDKPPRLGGYEVLKVLGKGGMGAVLLGRQISLDRKVALKVMHPKIAKNPSYVARFTREAYAAAQLTHHNVVQIYDIGEDKGRHFFSMEFVQGQSLTDVIKKEGKLAPDVAVNYILQAARGLRYSHNQGMVHRDIKPDNLLVNTEGIVKVADLGLVKLPAGELENLDAEETPAEARAPQLTHAGAVMGTPAYMSPEQATDSASVDARADIYSLGCTLYVLLTGKPPFEGKTALEIISKHQTEPIVPPDVVVKRVPPALSAILMKMMAKKPADRYQSMDEVIAALEGFLGLEHAGTFNPKEEQADQIEKCAHQYHFRSKAGLKRSLTIGFFVVCLFGMVSSALAGLPGLAGGFLGLAIMTPLAYFVVHGLFSGSIVFKKVRAVVFGMRGIDWLFWGGGGLLFLATLYLLGLLWSWLGFAVVAVVLAFALWWGVDRRVAQEQEKPLDEARSLLRSLRVQGLEEDAIRQFVCKYAGPYWEPLYEALFGYEAMIAARASRKGVTGETWKKCATWRDPIVQWADARMEAQRLARERVHLQKVEAQALVAEGVSQAEAQARAEEMAAQMVEQAAEAHQARREGKDVNIRELVAAARQRRRPQPGMTIAGKKHRNLWFKDFINNWFGRRLRLTLGAAVFAAGLLWLHQNNLLKDNQAITAISQGDLEAAQKAATATSRATTQPLKVPGNIVTVPTELQPVLNTWALPLTGLMLLLNGLFYFGWRPTVVTLPGAAIALFGPQFGIPDIDILTAQQLSLAIGAVLILVIARFVRQ